MNAKPGVEVNVPGVPVVEVLVVARMIPPCVAGTTVVEVVDVVTAAVFSRGTVVVVVTRGAAVVGVVAVDGANVVDDAGRVVVLGAPATVVGVVVVAPATPVEVVVVAGVTKVFLIVVMHRTVSPPPSAEPLH